MSQMAKEKDPKSCAPCISSCISCEEASPIATWVVMHRNTIAACLAAIAVIAFLCIWMSSNKKAAAYQTIQTANALVQELQASPSDIDEANETPLQSDQEALEKLQEICKQYPALQKRYDGLIAQELILDGSQQGIDPYATRSINQLRHVGLNHFAEFSEICRLASMQQYKEALAKATHLKETLSKSPKSQYLLRAFLLLHIASFEQTMNEQSNFELAVQELKNLLGITKTDDTLSSQEKELASIFLTHLQEKNESLLNYLSKNA